MSLKRKGAMRHGASNYGSTTHNEDRTEHRVTVNERYNETDHLVRIKKQVNEGDNKTDHLVRIKQQVNEVKDIMKDNIEKVIERDEKVSTLGERADNLKTQTHGFKENAKAIRRKEQCKSWKMTCCIVTVVIVILAVITIIILFEKKVI